jgi:tetratricopeptide (TPR) repeat protein
MPRREQLEQLLQTDPDDVFLNYALAVACVAEGDLAAGLERFDRVVELDPAYVAAYFQKGQALAAARQTEAARHVLRRGIEVARNTGDAHAAAEMAAFLDSL